ncbi:ABC transporter permease, partial [Streptomyces sp. NPDC002491]
MNVDTARRPRRRRRASAVVALVWLTLIALAALFAPLLAGHSPIAQDLLHVQASPSAEHLL